MRICIVTPGQPSNNPRMVKEADALTQAGHTVHAICADCGLWPSRMDPGVMHTREWTFEYAAGSARGTGGVMRRVRHKVARRYRSAAVGSAAFNYALSPVAAELRRAAMNTPAELYIAHHPHALPAVVDASVKFGAKVGYDVEDLYAGMGRDKTRETDVIEALERAYLPGCDYVTSAAPGFSREYARRYGIEPPVVILNVFPRQERPDVFRPTSLHAPLRLYWFSQCIGSGRGLEDVVNAMALLQDVPVELHLRGNWEAGYRERLYAFAASVGVDRNRLFSFQPDSPDDMVRLASQCDIGLVIEQSVDWNK